jgi:hypothetical protein
MLLACVSRVRCRKKMVNIPASLLLVQFFGSINVHDLNILEEAISINIVVGVHLSTTSSSATCIYCKISVFSVMG